jgi:hypothetical protein
MSTLDAPTPEPPPATPRWRTRLHAGWTVFAFGAGFIWDYLTLRRIDRLADNLQLLAYLVVLGALLTVEIRWTERADRARWRGWVTWAAQFLFGSLYSAYLVFYLKSVTLGRTCGFLALLALLLFANEFRAERLQTGRLRLALYWTCAFSFLLFFVPVVTGFPGPGLFGIAAVGASLASLAVAVIGGRGQPEPRRSILRQAATAVGLSAAMWVAAWLNIIPPVPFAMMRIGIFHSVERDDTGYALTYEAPPWWRWYRTDDVVFAFRPGDRVNCFTAVFAPTGMQTSVRHIWERYEGGWQVATDQRLALRGGRDGGFRTWSSKRNVVPGDWRVRVLTEAGAELAVYRFTVTDGTHQPRRPYVVRHEN